VVERPCRRARLQLTGLPHCSRFTTIPLGKPGPSSLLLDRDAALCRHRWHALQSGIKFFAESSPSKLRGRRSVNLQDPAASRISGNRRAATLSDGVLHTILEPDATAVIFSEQEAEHSPLPSECFRASLLWHFEPGSPLRWQLCLRRLKCKVALLCLPARRIGREHTEARQCRYSSHFNPVLRLLKHVSSSCLSWLRTRQPCH